VQSEAISNPPQSELQARPLPQITINQACDDCVSRTGLEQPPTGTGCFLDDRLTESESSALRAWDGELSDFTEVDDSDFDDETQTIDIKRLIRKQLSKAKKGSRIIGSKPHFYPSEPPARRVPGDYLAQNKSGISCVCSDCRESFLHAEKSNIPTACKRCERHAKIYKFGWPKTMGKRSETEDRCNDHRGTQRPLMLNGHGRRR
jgi:histone-lysine N-methyltransferase SUV420H